jgi:hypothetical protein
MPRPKKLTPWMVPDIESLRSKPNLAALDADEKRQISEAAQLQISEPDWRQIEEARTELTVARWVRPQAVEAQAFVKRLKSIDKAASDLLVALSGSKSIRQQGERRYSVDKISVLLSVQLFKGSPNYIEMISILNGLRSVALRAIVDAERPQADPWRDVWRQFVWSLASLFKRHGRRPTAAKQSYATPPRQSPFVAFVSAVAETLPRMARLHTQSPEAMAKAVADALSIYRKNRVKRASSVKAEITTAFFTCTPSPPASSSNRMRVWVEQIARARVSGNVDFAVPCIGGQGR